jgi:hypothetical protein
MPIVPNRCIWCLKASPDVSFDESHVFPECVGNHGQQVLPAGIVCKECNGYFGSKIEPIFLSDPIFHAIAVTLSLVDPEDMNVFRSKIFDEAHKPVAQPHRHLDLAPTIKPNEIELTVGYRISGTMRHTYSARELRKLSRAIHKYGFESLAWQTYVKGTVNPPDLFDNRFDAIRRWAREGHPTSSARPFLRKPAETLILQREDRFWTFEGHLCAEMRFFGEWWAISLTTPHELTRDKLKEWCSQNLDRAWWVADKLERAGSAVQPAIPADAEKTWRG